MNSIELKNRTKAFAIRIVKLAEALPKKVSCNVVANQIIRSGTSVASNYRASLRARSKSEFISKLSIVLEESDETLFWLELIAELKWIKPEQLKEITKEANELTAIFASSIITTKNNLKS